MMVWKLLWSLVWFGGLGVFVVLTGLVLVHGWADMRSMLRTLGQPDPPAAATEPRVERD